MAAMQNEKCHTYSAVPKAQSGPWTWGLNTPVLGQKKGHWKWEQVLVNEGRTLLKEGEYVLNIVPFAWYLSPHH